MKQYLSVRGMAALAILCACFPVQAVPTWWTEGPDPVLSSGPPDNHAVANLGQAKWMAKSALEALRVVVPDLADDIEADLVGSGNPIPSWAAPTPGSDLAKAQFAPLLIGQLKAISAPFYEHLHGFAPDWLDGQLAANETFHCGSCFPWTTTTADDANYGVVNLGQLKAVFSLDFIGDHEPGPDDPPLWRGGDHDGIPDLWESGVVHADGGVHWTAINQINLNNVAAVGAISPVGAAPDTLAVHAAAAVDERIAGLTASAAMPLFTTQNYSSNIFVRNTSFWATDLVQQLTCISPANSTGAASGNWKLRAGVAITSRHVLQCEHLTPNMNVGDEIRFVTAGNQVISRLVSARRQVGTTDFLLLVLDSDLPSSITPCKVAPSNLREYLPPFLTQTDVIGIKPGIPCLMLDQEEKGLVQDIGSIPHFDSPSSPSAVLNGPTESKRLEFYEGLGSGDSGNPCFWIVNDQLMLLATASTPTAGAGTFGVNTSAINSVISQLNTDIGISTPSAVTEFDLSAFPKF